MSKYSISELDSIAKASDNDLLLVSRMDDGHPIASNSITVNDFKNTILADVYEQISQESGSQTDSGETKVIAGNDDIIRPDSNIYEHTYKIDLDSNSLSNFHIAYCNNSNYDSVSSFNVVKTEWKNNRLFIKMDKDGHIPSGTYYQPKYEKDGTVWPEATITYELEPIDGKTCTLVKSIIFYKNEHISSYLDLNADKFYDNVNKRPCMNFNEAVVSGYVLSTKCQYTQSGYTNNYYLSRLYGGGSLSSNEEFFSFQPNTPTPYCSETLTADADCTAHVNCKLKFGLVNAGKTYDTTKFKIMCFNKNDERSPCAVYISDVRSDDDGEVYVNLHHTLRLAKDTKFKFQVDSDMAGAKYFYNQSEIRVTYVQDVESSVNPEQQLKIQDNKYQSNVITCYIADADTLRVTLSDMRFAITGSYIDKADRTKTLYVKDVTNAQENILTAYPFNVKDGMIEAFPACSFIVDNNTKLKLTSSRNVSGIAANAAKVSIEKFTGTQHTFASHMTMLFDTNVDAETRRYTYGWKYLCFDPDDGDTNTTTYMKEANRVVTPIVDYGSSTFVRPPASNNISIDLENVSRLAVSDQSGDYLTMGRRLKAIEIKNACKLDILTDYAFYGCENLTSFVNNCTTLTSIASQTFKNCKALSGDVSLNNVTNIEGSQQFCNCSSLNSISMSQFEGAVPYQFAYNCKNLRKADLRKAKVVSDYAFSGKDNAFSPKLVSIVASSTTPLADGQACFNAVEQIKSSAFEYCSTLTSAVLPNVKSIDSKAFNACSQLKTVNVQNIETIGQNSFYSNSNLTSFAVGSRLNTVEGYAFSSSKDCVFNFKNLSGDAPTLKNINAFPSPSTTTYHWKIQVTQAMYDKLIVAPNWQKFVTDKYDRFEVFDNASSTTPIQQAFVKTTSGTTINF